ncbi:TPA: hypothetical protein ACJJYB_005050, partial [Enterobacter hormaechei subsp. xiangfangensis]
SFFNLIYSTWDSSCFHTTKPVMLFYNKTLWFVSQSFIKNMNIKTTAIEVNKSIKFLNIL